jgi:hypothetical protein
MISNIRKIHVAKDPIPSIDSDLYVAGGFATWQNFIPQIFSAVWMKSEEHLDVFKMLHKK